MKTKFTLLLSALLVVGLAYDYNGRIAHSNSSGAQPGNTGSPGDGQNCSTSCHTGGPSQTNETIEVTTDIPASGYVGGTTYNVTVTMTKPGGTKFGFQLSPQDLSGNGLGTLIAGSGSQIVGTDYVTHNASGTAGSGTKTWTFQWTAPTAGTGDVTLYYAGNFASNSNGQFNDVIVTGSVVAEESSSTGISEAELAAISVYPNPVIDEIHVAALDVDEEIMVTLFSVDGKMVYQQLHTEKEIAVDVKSMNLNSGLYVLQLDVAGKTTVKKLLVR